MLIEVRANKRSSIRLVAPMFVRRAHRRRLVFSKMLGYAAAVLVLFVGTLGKYPKLTVFVFPALHALAFSLLAAIEYKFDAQMYRLELLLNAKARKRSLRLFEGRRNSTTTRQRTMSASAIQTDSASKDAMIELVSASGFAHQLETDRPASPAAAESLKEDSLPATSTSALNALAASGASSTVLMPNHKTPIAVDTGIAGAGTATSSSDVVRRDSHTATADDANKLRRISSQYPEATVLRNTSGRKLLAEQHTFRAVLAHCTASANAGCVTGYHRVPSAAYGTDSGVVSDMWSSFK